MSPSSSSVPHFESSKNGPPTNGETSLYEPPSSYPPRTAWGLFTTLWNGKWLILGLAVLLAGISYFYWTHQPKQYRTAAILLLNEPEKLEQFDISLPFNQPNRTERNLYFLRNSEVFAEAVARRLVDSVSSKRSLQGSLIQAPNGEVSPSSLAKRLQQSVSIARDSREVSALRIGATSADPQEAALIANTYAESYLEHLRRSSNTRLRSSRQFLEEQRNQLRDRLRSIEDTITAHVREQGQAGLVPSRDSSAGMVGEARQIAGEISDLRLQKERVQLELNVEQAMLDSTHSRLERIQPNLARRASSNTASRLEGKQQEIANLQDRIQEIRIQNEQLESPLRSELDRMEARVESLKKESQQLADQYVREALSTDAINPLGEEEGLSSVVDLRRRLTEHQINISKLRARQSALEDRINTRRAALQASPDRTLARLKRRKNTTEELFVELSKSLQKIQVSEESSPQQAQILQEARLPSQPIGPDVRRNVLLAFLLGGTLGAGLVVLYDRHDDRMDQPGDIERHGIGLFGLVPSWGEDSSTGSQFHSELDSSGTGLRSRRWPEIAAPLSPAAEAYRHVATNLRLGVPTSLDTLLVTSPQPKDGKSTTTANLGVVLSEAGQDVLIVDADLYGFSLHRQFGCERDPGLTDRLAEGTEAVQILLSPGENTGATSPQASSRISHSQSKHLGRLGLLPSGTSVPQPSLLLQEDPFETLLQKLQAEWDLLLLDTPPVLSYNAASRLAALSDMVLLVAAANTTRRGAYAEAVDRLAPLCPGPVVGMLNRCEASNGPLYGYGYSTYPSSPKPTSTAERIVKQTKRGFHRLATGR